MNFLKRNWQLLSIVAGGLALRLYNLTSISLWHDEAFSALLIKYPWAEMLHRISLDVHPPVYYIFLRLWHYALGDSLLSLRGFSVLFGVGTILATYWLVKTAFNNRSAALVAALLVAVSPFQISYVTEARMYTMGAFFGVLGALALVRAMALQQAALTKFRLYYLLFAVCMIIIMYTHYYLFFTAAAIGFYGLVFHLRSYKWQVKRYGWLLLSFVVIGLAYLPWLQSFLYQFRQVGGNYWIPAMDRWSIPDTLWRLVVGLYTNINFSSQAGVIGWVLNIPNHKLLIIISLVTIVILVSVARRTSNFAKWLILFNVVAPFAGAILFALLARLRGESSSVFLVRYFLFAAPFLLITIALWLQQFPKRRLAQMLLIGLVAINVYAYARNWSELDMKNRPGMDGAAKFLNRNVEPHHKIYLGSSFEFFNFKYYNQRNVAPLLYTGGITDISQLPHYAGTAILTNEDLLPDFKAATKNGDTVWLLWTTGFGGTKPQVPNNWTQIDEKAYADVKPYPGTWIVVTQYKVN